MKRLVIIGAGGLGREIADSVAYINAERSTYELVGFVDDNLAHHHTSINGIKVIGGRDALKEIAQQRPIAAVVAINDATVRQSVVNFLGGLITWETLVHPRALVSPSAQIGKGCILQAYVLVAANATIGDHCIVNAGSGLGHDALMGDYGAIMSQCDVTGCARLGSAVFMGSGARILPGVVVGERAKIAAGAVVARNVQAGSIVGGNPARVIG
jgi:sugar O-acyltransferase (sialic acid O-acetyltransferase NeuD family)